MSNGSNVWNKPYLLFSFLKRRWSTQIFISPCRRTPPAFEAVFLSQLYIRLKSISRLSSLLIDVVRLSTAITHSHDHSQVSHDHHVHEDDEDEVLCRLRRRVERRQRDSPDDASGGLGRSAVCLCLASLIHSSSPPHSIPFQSPPGQLTARGEDLKEYFQHGRALLPTASILCLLMNHSHTDKKHSGWLTLTVSGPFQELLNLSYM